MKNIKHYARKLLANKEFSTHKYHHWHLKGVLYALQKLQLDQACVCGRDEQRVVDDYNDLEVLIGEVNHRVAQVRQ